MTPPDGFCSDQPDAGADHLHAASYLETLANATAGELELANKAHLFLQQARRDLPERKPAAEAGRVRVQKKADRR